MEIKLKTKGVDFAMDGEDVSPTSIEGAMCVFGGGWGSGFI